MAWQVGAHWGNRRFARPQPRPEVLAAILSHDAAWDAFDADPALDTDGRPRTFDRMEPLAHLAIWEACVRRAAQVSRYAALLVAVHFSTLSSWKIDDLASAGLDDQAEATRRFVATLEDLIAAWRRELAADTRYEHALDGPGWQVNASVLGACDRLSVHLCAGLSGSFELQVLGRGGDPLTVRVTPLGGRRFRLDPWPLEGTRLAVHCEGRRLPASRFASRDELRRALGAASPERLAFQLLRPSTSGPRG